MDRPVMAEERHPLITSLPTGLWLASLGADVMYRTGRAPASWDEAAFFSMFAGLVAALLLLELQLAVGGLFALNLCLRAYAPASIGPVWLSFAGIALLVVAAAVGGETARSRPFPREIVIVTRRGRTARSA
jgi:uncharacterized membrane protein